MTPQSKAKREKYKLGQLLGFDVYIDLSGRRLSESNKMALWNRAALIFEDFWKLHNLKNDLKDYFKNL